MSTNNIQHPKASSWSESDKKLLPASEDQSREKHPSPHAARDKTEEWDMRQEQAHAKLQDAMERHLEMMTDSGDKFLQELSDIGADDAAGLKAAQKSYGNSWKSRGGVGAFMMLARKWDRMENRLKVTINREREGLPTVPAYDIFAHIAADPRSEGIIDDVRDLRRYLMLVEAEMIARGFNATHRDNQ